MLVLVNRIITAIEHRLEIAARARTRRELLDRSDRFLEDVGISRALLEAGVHAWPWREDDAASPSPAMSGNRRGLRQAIRELNAYSDRELADLGLARTDIPFAVRYGRPGIDRGARSAGA